MCLNIHKCHSISFTRSKEILNYSYSIGKSTLKPVNEIIHLGVTLITNLSLTHHINNIITESSKILEFIKKYGRNFTDKRALKIFYCSFWIPFYIFNIVNFKQVQHKFLRHVAYKFNCNLNYSALEHKDIKLLYNIINSNVSCPSLLEKVGSHMPLKSTRSAKTFHQRAHRTNYGYNSFIYRAPRFANLNIDTLDFLSGLSHFLKEL